MPKDKVKTELSKGNVFEDIGFESDEAAEKLLKSKLIQKISAVIKTRGLK